MDRFHVDDLRLGMVLRKDPWALAAELPTRFNGRYELSDYPSLTAPIRGDLSLAMVMLASIHFGIPVQIEVNKMLDDCAAAVIEFFFGDWFLYCRDPVTLQPAPMTRDEANSLLKGIWFPPYTHGVFLCMIGNLWQEAKKVSSWIQSDLDMDYQGDLEPEVGQIIIAMAASIADNREVDLESLATAIAKTRKKRPKLLFDLLKAVCERDQEAFDSALAANLKHFASRKPDQWELCDDWIAWYPSTLCLYGNHLGLKTPELPRSLAIRLITRESVGLEG